MTKPQIIIESLAEEYAVANPDASVSQIAQLFGLPLSACHALRRRAHAGTTDPKLVEEAYQWAVANNAGFMRIMSRFDLREKVAERIAAAVKIATTEARESLQRRIDEAIEYALKHRSESNKQVADKFGITVYHIEKRRRIAMEKIRASEPLPRKPVNRKRNRLYAIVDGQSVPLASMRRFDCIERFVGVKTCQNVFNHKG
jgi:hypothetical protein